MENINHIVIGPLDVERCLREAPERLERIKKFQKQMEDQQKISHEVLSLEFTI
jgi:predicted ribonuclease toxin of YeeF-YezG toxin-antitoxin module